MSLRRFAPTRTAWVALIGLLWAISFGALRDFVWEDLRSGLIRLGGLTRPTRYIIVVGFAMLFAAVGVLLTTDIWRMQSELQPANIDIPGRGNLLPSLLLPMTLTVQAVAWSFLLAGALRVHPLLGSLPLFLYATTAFSSLLAGTGPAIPFIWLGWLALALVFLLFLLPAGRRLPTDVAFLVFLGLVGIQVGLIQVQTLVQDRVSGIGLGQINLESTMQSLQSLALPFLFLLGMDIARFTQQASTWTLLVVRRRLPPMLTYAAFILLLTWSGYVHVGEIVEQLDVQSGQAVLIEHLGALGIPVAILIVWLLIRTVSTVRPGRTTHAEVGEAAEGAVVWIILAHQATIMLAFLLYHFQSTLAGAAYSTGGLLQSVILFSIALMSLAADAISRTYDAWTWLTAAAALGVGIILARTRPHQIGVALYVAAYGALALWNLATRSQGPLAAFDWQNQAQVHVWFLLLIGGVALAWTLSRRLTPARAGGLLFLLLILWLLRQTDFIENPFSPFFGFAGIGFIAFGIVWDALTAGAWANEGSPRLPRQGRIFLYLGYVLLTVTLINWALATHNLDTIGRFTGDAALLGLGLVGKPLLYLLMPLVIFQPAQREIE